MDTEGARFGCDNYYRHLDNCSDVLTKDNFEYHLDEGTTYTVESLYWIPSSNNELSLRIGRHSGAKTKEALGSLTLNVDGTALAVSNATSSLNTIDWSYNLGWTDGQRVSVSLTDPTAPRVTLHVTPAEIANHGEGSTATLTATLEKPADHYLVVQMEELPPYPPLTVTGTRLTIPAGSTKSKGDITLFSYGSRYNEPDRTYSIPVGYSHLVHPDSDTAFTVKVIDSDPTPTLTVSLDSDTVAEGGRVAVRAKLDRPSGVDTVVTITVAPGTAQAGDYRVHGYRPDGTPANKAEYRIYSTETAPITPDDQPLIEIEALNDADVELAETVTVTASAVNEAGIVQFTKSLTLTIGTPTEEPSPPPPTTPSEQPVVPTAPTTGGGGTPPSQQPQQPAETEDTVPEQCEETLFDCEDARGIEEGECDALVALYDATCGADWNWAGLHPQKTRWFTTPFAERWQGVTLEEMSVRELSLDGRNLRGELPQELADLESLEVLDLSSNQGLTGDLPREQPEELLSVDIRDTGISRPEWADRIDDFRPGPRIIRTVTTSEGGCAVASGKGGGTGNVLLGLLLVVSVLAVRLVRARIF